MKKNIKCAIITLISIMTIMTMSFSSFATSVNNVDVNGKERPNMRKLENMVIGKISAIDANNMTIEVATLKENEKNATAENKNDNAKKRKPNFDEMFTLTGEKKTINIASAEFGNKRSVDANVSNENGTKKSNFEKKSYADYKVGDYVAIQATDNTFATAKRVNNAMFGRMRGFRDNGKNKGKRENNWKEKNKGNTSTTSD